MYVHRSIDQKNFKLVEKAEALEKCLDYLLNTTNDRLLNSMKSIVNKRDRLKNTALHHASRLWPGKNPVLES
jgi:hypothetical protein